MRRGIEIFNSVFIHSSPVRGSVNFQLTLIIDLFTPRLGGGEYKYLIHDTQFIYSPLASEEGVVNFEYTMIIDSSVRGV